MSFLKKLNKVIETIIEGLVFASRWTQAPIYLGLIFGSVLYVYKFIDELVFLTRRITTFTETQVMLSILGLIDISMVMNLLVIVIIGGYSIFTSRIDFDEQEDRPHWIDHLDADRLKVKLATSLASISGVHLLKTFIDIHSETETGSFDALSFEIIIHLVFIISALILAWIARILDQGPEVIKKSGNTSDMPKL
ncbi:MAG: TIGR00645 family protein [Bacteroidota bacterium]